MPVGPIQKKRGCKFDSAKARTSLPIWVSTRAILNEIQKKRDLGSTIKLIDKLAKEEATRLGIDAEAVV